MYGLHPRAPPVGNHLDAPDENTREDRHRYSHEHGCVVRITHYPTTSHPLTEDHSAAVTAFIKTSKLVNIAQVQDFTCECLTLPAQPHHKNTILTTQSRVQLQHHNLGLRRNRANNIRRFNSLPPLPLRASTLFVRPNKLSGSRNLQRTQQ